jgi:uncharacterized protein (DUF305 family)
MKRLPILVLTLIVVMVATAATAVGVVMANRDDHPRVGMGPGMTYPGSSTTGGWDDSGDSMMTASMMTASMMMGPHATASEAEYLVEMVAHHREAVVAARGLVRSDRPQMRALGESIVETQSAQIEQMTSWLADWYPEQSTTVAYRPMMRDLSGLSGDPLDRAFLQDMIGHHMVAVMISQHLLWRGTDHEEVADLARSIRDDQHSEIIQMQRWLAQWFDADWGGMGSGMWSGHGSGSGMGPGMTWGTRP